MRQISLISRSQRSTATTRRRGRWPSKRSKGLTFISMLLERNAESKGQELGVMFCIHGGAMAAMDRTDVHRRAPLAAR